MGTVAVVYDTNVLISGIGFGGKPWRCLVEVFVGDVELITSEDALSEFERVLRYNHLPFTPSEQERFPELLRREATVVEPDVSIKAVDDDPDDDVFLQCAVPVTLIISSPATPTSPASNPIGASRYSSQLRF